MFRIDSFYIGSGPNGLICSALSNYELALTEQQGCFLRKAWDTLTQDLTKVLKGNGTAWQAVQPRSIEKDPPLFRIGEDLFI